MSGNDTGPGSPWGRPGDGMPDRAQGDAPNPQWEVPANGSSATQQPAPPSWGQPQDAQPPAQTSWGQPQDAQQPQTSWGGEASAQQPTWGTDTPTTQQPAWGDAQAPADQQPAWGLEAPTTQQPTWGTDTPTTQLPPAADAAPAGAGAWGAEEPMGAVPHPGGASAGGQPPQGGTPWYKRPAILVSAIGGVVLLLLAAIGIPLGIHLSNVAKGDQLADDFNAALDAHNAAWTSENIATVGNVVVSDALQENFDFNAQSNSAMNDLATRCANVATAASTLDELLGAPVPTLPEESGADASAKYQEAQSTSDGLADRRGAVDSLTTDGAAAMSALSDFCTVYPEYNSIINSLAASYTDVFRPTLTFSEGERIDLGNNLYLTCTWEIGCPNFADQGARTAFGDATDTTYTSFYGDMAAKAATTCFLPEFQAVCDTIASEYQATSDAYRLAAEAIRTEQPVLTVGSNAFPTFFPAWAAAIDRQTAADIAIDAAWQSSDPNAVDNGTGWQARSMKATLAAHEATVTDAVAQLG